MEKSRRNAAISGFAAGVATAAVVGGIIYAHKNGGIKKNAAKLWEAAKKPFAKKENAGEEKPAENNNGNEEKK